MNIIQPEQKYLIHLLSSVLHDVQPQNPPEGLDWGKLYKISSWHSTANMAFYGVQYINRDRQPPQEIMMKFHGAYKKALAKEAAQHIAVEQILNVFEENAIPCMPLKGYIIKYLYPRPDMRLMADVDILFKDEQTEQVKELMLGLGFTSKHQGGNHDIYCKEPYISIEMHRRLIGENSPYSMYLNKTWDRASLKPDCKFTYQQYLEDFYIYLLIHLTKHYMNGGTGIRSFMDMYLYKHRYGSDMDWNYIWTELDKINIREFAENICGLGEAWFNNNQTNELYEQMTEYILSCGVYGTRENALMSSIGIKAGKKHSIRTGRILYRLKLFFPPLGTMKILYPILAILPFLLPIYWMLRGVRCLLFKPKHTLKMINSTYSVSDKDVTRLRALHEKAGLLK